MKRVATLLFALCLLSAGSAARADIGPPAGKKIVPVTTVVEAGPDLDDYAFFETSWSSSPGPKGHSSSDVTLPFFVPGTKVERTGDRRTGGTLYGVPRAKAEE